MRTISILALFACLFVGGCSKKSKGATDKSYSSEKGKFSIKYPGDFSINDKLLPNMVTFEKGRVRFAVSWWSKSIYGPTIAHFFQNWRRMMTKKGEQMSPLLKATFGGREFPLVLLKRKPGEGPWGYYFTEGPSFLYQIDFSHPKEDSLNMGQYLKTFQAR